MKYLILLSAIFLAGCSNPNSGIPGSGKLVTKEMSLGDFDQIDASSAFQFEVSHGAASSVVVTADDNLWDSVEVRNEGGTLHLSMKSGSYNNIHVSAKVVMPHLSALTLSGAANGSIQDFNDAAGRLVLTLSGASNLNGELRQEQVTLNGSGASKATLRGTADRMNITLTGASRGFLNDFISDDISADLSGASNANVTARRKLDFGLSGASNLTYAGSPTIGRSNVLDASSVHPAR